jgi:DNA-cytosine methyltransferase
LNILSLFDGCAGAYLALERAGISIDNYFAAEIDKYAIKIAKKNYPDIIHLGDINNWHTWKLPKIDLIIGGSPCQGFSRAGSIGGFDDVRSRLFFQFINCLSLFKPKYFLLENVNMKQEFQYVINLMTGVEPVRINSSLFSAQLRDRLYWTNIPVDLEIKDKKQYLQEIIEPGWYAPKEKSYCIDANYYKKTTVAHYVKHHVRQIVIRFPIENKLIKPAMLAGLITKNDFRCLLPVECERLQTMPDNYTEGVSNTQRYKMLGNGFTVDVVAHILKGIKK